MVSLMRFPRRSFGVDRRGSAIPHGRDRRRPASAGGLSAGRRRVVAHAAVITERLSGAGDDDGDGPRRTITEPLADLTGRNNIAAVGRAANGGLSGDPRRRWTPSTPAVAAGINADGFRRVDFAARFRLTSWDQGPITALGSRETDQPRLVPFTPAVTTSAWTPESWTPLPGARKPADGEPPTVDVLNGGRTRKLVVGQPTRYSPTSPLQAGAGHPAPRQQRTAGCWPSLAAANLQLRWTGRRRRPGRRGLPYPFQRRRWSAPD